MYAKGYVKNNSDRVLSYIKVKTVSLIVQAKQLIQIILMQLEMEV